MPIIDEATGNLAIILFTIFWGIIIETRFVSRHTIWFNIVPLLTLLSSIDMDFVLLYSLIGYAAGSIVLSMIPRLQGIKQLVGAKGYGSLSLSLLIFKPETFTVEVLGSWVVFASIAYFLWWRYKKWANIP